MAFQQLKHLIETLKWKQDIINDMNHDIVLCNAIGFNDTRTGLACRNINGVHLQIDIQEVSCKATNFLTIVEIACKRSHGHHMRQQNVF